MKCSDVNTYRPLYRVTQHQFGLLTENKITNPFLALMVNYHVRDQKGQEEFSNVFGIGYDFPVELRSIKKSPFISVTLHPWLAMTAKSFDDKIVENDCVVELDVPLIYVIPTPDEMYRKGGELLLLLPSGVDLKGFIVGTRKNVIYGRAGHPLVSRKYLKDKYGINGGLVEYNGRYLSWNWTYDYQMGIPPKKNPWNEFLKSQKGSGYSIRELRSVYADQ